MQEAKHEQDQQGMIQTPHFIISPSLHFLFCYQFILQWQRNIVLQNLTSIRLRKMYMGFCWPARRLAFNCIDFSILWRRQFLGPVATKQQGLGYWKFWVYNFNRCDNGRKGKPHQCNTDVTISYYFQARQVEKSFEVKKDQERAMGFTPLVLDDGPI